MKNEENENEALNKTDVSSSVFSFDDFDKLMNTKEEPQEPINMPKDEFVEKTKKLLNYISDQYFKGWKSKRLTEEEYPEESICDKCTGCGTFKFNGEDGECVADREEGECYVRYFDAEEFGLEIEATMDDVYELLFIDNVE
jgi:hypothetical protein